MFISVMNTLIAFFLTSDVFSASLEDMYDEMPMEQPVYVKYNDRWKCGACTAQHQSQETNFVEMYSEEYEVENITARTQVEIELDEICCVTIEAPRTAKVLLMAGICLNHNFSLLHVSNASRFTVRVYS